MSTFTPKEDQIAMLLAKAERAGTEEEAATFMFAAQRKAERASLDLEMLRRKNTENNQKGPKGSNVVSLQFEIGKKGDRGAGAYTDLFWAISDVNGVELIMNNAQVTAYGVESDIEYTHALYQVILPQMIEARIQYINSDEWRGEPGVNIHDARRSFCQGYIERIKRRLWEAKREALNEAEQEFGREETALVLADKRREVRKQYMDAARHLRTRKRTSGKSSAARTSGRAHANNARIRQSEGVEASKPISK